MDDVLARHLYTRGRTEPNLDLDKTILDNDELLGRIAGTWKDRKEEIATVVGARMAAIERYMVQEMIPIETTVMRQALAEMEALLALFEKYDAEYERRTKPNNEPHDGQS